MRFDLTLPGYNYCGPGTKATNTKPVNLLDQCCMEHDLFYVDNVDTKSRRVADKLLAKQAWKIFVYSNNFSERLVALFIYGVMSLKVKIMPIYNFI